MFCVWHGKGNEDSSEDVQEGEQRGINGTRKI